MWRKQFLEPIGARKHIPWPYVYGAITESDWHPAKLRNSLFNKPATDQSSILKLCFGWIDWSINLAEIQVLLQEPSFAFFVDWRQLALSIYERLLIQYRDCGASQSTGHNRCLLYSAGVTSESSILSITGCWVNIAYLDWSMDKYSKDGINYCVFSRFLYFARYKLKTIICVHCQHPWVISE